MSRSKTPSQEDGAPVEDAGATDPESAAGAGDDVAEPVPAPGAGDDAAPGDGRGDDATGLAAPSPADAAASDDGLGETAPRRRRAPEPAASPPPPERLEGAVEAVLLAAGEALSAERIRDLLGLPSAVHVRDAIAAIRARWATAALSVEIQDVAGGHRVVTRPEFAEYVRRLWRRASSDRLSQTLLETLSIVAYKQPVARAEIERIRGVQCGETLRSLLERRLVKVAGRSDQPGRPLLYATTTRFLEVFGLAGLEDLPNAKDLARL